MAIIGGIFTKDRPVHQFNVLHMIIKTITVLQHYYSHELVEKHLFFLIAFIILSSISNI